MKLLSIPGSAAVRASTPASRTAFRPSRRLVKITNSHLHIRREEALDRRRGLPANNEPLLNIAPEVGDHQPNTTIAKLLMEFGQDSQAARSTSKMPEASRTKPCSGSGDVSISFSARFWKTRQLAKNRGPDETVHDQPRDNVRLRVALPVAKFPGLGLTQHGIIGKGHRLQEDNQ